MSNRKPHYRLTSDGYFWLITTVADRESFAKVIDDEPTRDLVALMAAE